MRPDVLENVLLFYIQRKSSCDEVDSPKPEAVSHYGKHPSRLWETIPGTANLSESPFPVPFQHAELNAEQKIRASDFGKKLVEIAEEFSAKRPDKSPISFASTCLFVPAKQQTLSIIIQCQKEYKNFPLKVMWKTQDRTAASSIHYVGSSGELVFEEGKREHRIDVQTLPFENLSENLRFQVELFIKNSAYEPKPLTISFYDANGMENDEKNIVDCLSSLMPDSIPGVYRVLKESLNPRTFCSALCYLCSLASNLPTEIALGLELSRLCLQDIPYQNVFDTLNDFFRADDIDL